MNQAEFQELGGVIITRAVSTYEVDRLRASLLTVDCSDVSLIIDTDDGAFYKCRVRVGEEVATVEINMWNPSSVPLIRISGSTPTAVAAVSSHLWPDELHVDDLLTIGKGMHDDSYD